MILYRKNYFKIYFWQAISIVLGFASLFVVVPYLSTNKTLFGIYSICTSLIIFFSYADLGFISAGLKYAAEYFIRGDIKNEMRIIGFTTFIMVSAFCIVSLVIALLGIFPELLIPDVKVDSEEYYIARVLLLVLAVSCPIMIGQRILSIVFTIRVEDYLYQRMMIIGNITRILSVLYFFRDDSYRVVEYYIFYQIVNFIVVICGLIYSKKYGYKITEFISYIRFDKEVFNKVKKISATSFIMTISMILYYELDQIVISHFIGIQAVALYGAALSILTLIRNFCSLVYSPYASRYNHYIGLNDMNGLTSFVNKMILTFGLLVIMPIVTVAVFSKPFIISWIGESYNEAALLVSFMVLSFTPNFIKDPINSYFVATERNRFLLKSSIYTPLIYWIGIFISIKYLGIYSFAIFKFIAPTVVAIYYWHLASVDFKKKNYMFVKAKEVIRPLLLPLIAILVLGYFTLPHMFYHHDKISLMCNIIIMGICLLCVIIIGIFSNKMLRMEVSNYSKEAINKFFKNDK